MSAIEQEMLLIDKVSSSKSKEEVDQLPNPLQEFLNNSFTKLFKLWKNKRLPIEDQSEECIEFIYHLFFK